MHDLIYCQKAIPKDQWRYGLRSSAATGCGWIATYNALHLLGEPAEPEALIRYYERQVPLLQGNCGTLALSPVFFFRKRGFRVSHISRYECFDEAAKEADVNILFYRWHRKWKLGAHFIALEYRDGGFVGYNTYANSTGPDRLGPSLEEFLRQKKYFGAVLISIRK